MKLASLAFENETEIPNTYAYHGKNLSPATFSRNPSS